MTLNCLYNFPNPDKPEKWPPRHKDTKQNCFCPKCKEFTTKTLSKRIGKHIMIKSIFTKIKQNHFLAMILCCAIPVIGILALSSLGVLGSWGYYILILLCPIGHIFLMRGMHSTHAEQNVQPEVNEIEHKSQ
jgi:hypothetical protein